MVIILILIVLWGVVLIPAAVRWVHRRSGAESIDSFHHSLHLLEHSGPKFVEPAYRLESLRTEGQVALAPVPKATLAPPRPRLVLLRPIGQGEGDPMHDDFDDYVDEGSGERYERVAYQRDEPSYEDFDDGYREPSRPSSSAGRSAAALRRRNILFGLVGAIGITALGGFVISALWTLCILLVLALCGYVGLMAYAATHGMMTRPSALPERHIAHGVSSDDSYSRQARGDFDESLDDGWWEEPRRAAAR